LLIRYGNFFQCAHPIPRGHVSVAIETTADVPAVVASLERLLGGWEWASR
jgi:hypothetical protein